MEYDQTYAQLKRQDKMRPPSKAVFGMLSLPNNGLQTDARYARAAELGIRPNPDLYQDRLVSESR